MASVNHAFIHNFEYFWLWLLHFQNSFQQRHSLIRFRLRRCGIDTGLYVWIDLLWFVINFQVWCFCFRVSRNWIRLRSLKWVSDHLSVYLNLYRLLNNTIVWHFAWNNVWSRANCSLWWKVWSIFLNSIFGTEIDACKDYPPSSMDFLLMKVVLISHYCIVSLVSWRCHLYSA